MQIFNKVLFSSLQGCTQVTLSKPFLPYTNTKQDTNTANPQNRWTLAEREEQQKSNFWVMKSSSEEAPAHWSTLSLHYFKQMNYAASI